MKPTALDAIILKHEGRATQHGSATRAEMMKLAEAALRELRVKTELCEAVLAVWYGTYDTTDAIDVDAREAYTVDAYRQWRAEQEQQT